MDEKQIEKIIKTVREGIVTTMVSKNLCLVERKDLDTRSNWGNTELPILTLTDPVAEILRSGLCRKT